MSEVPLYLGDPRPSSFLKMELLELEQGMVSRVSFSVLYFIRRRYDVHRVSSSLLGPVDPSCRALSGRLKFTVRRHKLNKDSLPWSPSSYSTRQWRPRPAFPPRKSIEQIVPSNKLVPFEDLNDGNLTRERF